MSRLPPERPALRSRLPRLPRVEQLLPLACIATASVLFASELMTTFEFIPPGGEPLAEQTAADRHGYALAVVAVLAVVATLVAVFGGSKPAAVSVGLAGVIALLVFLIVDLPDAGAVGTLEDARQSFFDAEAVPRAGFWLGLIGALGLTVSGIALATLTPDQLGALRPGATDVEGPPPPAPPNPPTSTNSQPPELTPKPPPRARS